MKRVLFLFAFLFSLEGLAQGGWEALERWLWQAARATSSIPYVYGGEDPRRGMDCSAYVRWVYQHLGVNLPRTSREQFYASVPIREYVPGALLFFSESGREIDHVAIYIGRGYMLHASASRGGVGVDPVSRYAKILVAIALPKAFYRGSPPPLSSRGP